MGKKNNNQNNENILSSRMKKTNHGSTQGKYGQQAEINIFVDTTSTTTPEPFVEQSIPQSNKGQRNSLLQDKMNRNRSNDVAQNTNHEFTVFANSDEDENISSNISYDTHNPLYSDMYKKQKKNKKKEKKQKPVNKNTQTEILDGKNGNPFEKKIPAKTKLIIAVSIILSFLIIVELVCRVPALISENPSKPALVLIEDKNNTIQNYIKVENGLSDWDGDGILNAEDEYVFNPDVNSNSLPDSVKTKDKFIDKKEIITYENITIEAKNQKFGVSKFLNYYIFSNYNGWAKIENEEGIPYKYTDNGWKKATYKKDGSTYFVQITGNCRIEFVPEDTQKVYVTNIIKENIFGTSESRYVKNYSFFAPVYANLLKLIFPVTEATSKTLGTVSYSDTYHVIQYKNLHVAEAVYPDSSNYELKTLINYECSYEKLYKIYEAVDKKNTNLISIITKDGKEATGFVYAYDYLGNLYVADAKTSKTVGVIQITPKAQVYKINDKEYIREWYEFEGLGFSSKDGDTLIVY